MAAFIEQLQAQLIQVNAIVFGGERFIKENGQVIDRGPSFRGFSLDSNGLLKASRAEITNSYIDDVVIGKSAVFAGTVDSGPLHASNEIQTPPAGRTWTNNTLIGTIRSDLDVGSIPENGSRTVNFGSGQLGSKQGITQLTFESKFLYYQPPMVVNGVVIGVGRNVFGLRLRIHFNDNTVTTFEDTMGSGININQGRINQSLTVGGGNSGGTLRFNNLPSGPAGPSGTVYRNGNQLMIV